jgi:hypothetical protein
VGVAVHGHRDRRVPEVDLDGFGVGTGGDQQAGAGVAQIVNSEAVGELRLLDGLVPDLAPEVAVAQRCTLR